MHFSTVFAASALAGSAMATNFDVVVGNNSKLAFEPNNIKAAKGDTVTFKFWPKNHSVVQGSFAKPCEPLADDKGFWSGFVPSSSGKADTSFVFTVQNESQPIWFYCSQGQHCQNGMVGVINENSSSPNTLEKYTSNAKNVQQAKSPSSSAGTTGNGVLQNGTTTTNPSSTSSGAAASGTSTGSSAAQNLEINKSLALSGAFGMLAYFFL